MDKSTRADTLDALSTFIRAQKSLLARTHADISRLALLRNSALARPRPFIHLAPPPDATLTLPKLRDDLAFSTDFQYAAVPDNMHWEAFANSDPAPLRAFALATRTAHTTPHTTQRSPLSPLQRFVKDARRSIIDPVVDHLPSPTPSPPPPPIQEPQPPSRKRARDHAKIRDLKKRRLDADANGEEDGVFVRTDIGDESAEVDIGAGVDMEGRLGDESAVDEQMSSPDLSVVPSLPPPSDPDPPPSLHASAPATPTNADIATPRPSRSRKPSHKLQSQRLQSQSQFQPQSQSLQSQRLQPQSQRLQPQPQPLKPKLKIKLKLKPEPSPPPPTPPTTLGKRTRKPPLVSASASASPSLASTTRSADYTATSPAKSYPTRNSSAPSNNLAKPGSDADPQDTLDTAKHDTLDTAKQDAQDTQDTYKLAWSVSEQHLLERLLEEIPDGERNRWAQISRAMNGRRTARQVASRVQKYFEKLRRFGVGGG
ncbi:hypothetical protein BV22DRAFT_1061989 [Leucogyrophana mollusca]|uniref:Uncharacterized protein n=1 Tax=Leucogyrophana mollusca TaxID=85980 RepID=A0ACB8BQR0_9AGAM|nr:hypothetical protein BV22DRAFT_1061989 [Leucogyrophana mollusca]